MHYPAMASPPPLVAIEKAVTYCQVATGKLCILEYNTLHANAVFYVLVAILILLHSFDDDPTRFTIVVNK